MNDRFLTRYFDKETQAIYYPHPITNTCENGKDIVFYGILVSGTGQISEYDLNNMYATRFIRMQCTGLKDENGKLIYEGDIVKFNKKFHLKPKQVIWDECHYILKDTLILLCNMEIEQFGLEVIGNTHENLELLTHSSESEG